MNKKRNETKDVEQLIENILMHDGKQHGSVAMRNLNITNRRRGAHYMTRKYTPGALSLSLIFPVTHISVHTLFILVFVIFVLHRLENMSRVILKLCPIRHSFVQYTCAYIGLNNVHCHYIGRYSEVYNLCSSTNEKKIPSLLLILNHFGRLMGQGFEIRLDIWT